MKAGILIVVWAGLLGLTGSRAAGEASPLACVPGIWKLELDQLRVALAEDDGGDEPYLVVIGFRTTLGVPGSTRIFWNRKMVELGSDLERGPVVPIPPEVGVVRFGEVDNASEITLLGAVVVAMESDGTPFSSIEELFAEVVGLLEEELRTQAENSPTELLNLSNVNAIATRITGSINLSIPKMIALWLESWSDPDEIIDVQALVYVEGLQPWMVLLGQEISIEDPVLTRSRPWESGVSLLGEQTFDWPNSIRFDGRDSEFFGDAFYSVTGRMTSTVLRGGDLGQPAPGSRWWDSVSLSVQPCAGGHPLSHVFYKARFDRGDGLGPQTHTVAQRSLGEFDAAWDTRGIPPQKSVPVWAELVSNSFGGSVNSSEHRIDLNIETTPPTGRITLPVAGSFHGATMRFAAQVADAQSGVDRVEFFLQTQQGRVPVPLTGTPENSFAITWGVEHLEEQVVSVGATVYDRQNNQAALALIPDVTIDHTPPAVSSAYPSPDPLAPTWIRASDGLTLRARADDPSGIREVRFTAFYRDQSGRLEPHLIGTATRPNAYQEYTVPWSVSSIPDQADRSQPRQLYVDVAGIDGAGNEGIGTGWIAGFDRTAPQVRLVAPDRPVYLQGGLLPIQVQARDDLGVGQAVRELAVSVRYQESGAVPATEHVLATVADATDWTGALPLDALPEQVLAITVSAADEAGNTASQGQHATLDRTAPGISEVRHSPEPFLVSGSRNMSFSYRLDEPARSLEIALQDAVGKAVHSLKFADVNTDPQVAVWDGRDEYGNLVPSGAYAYTLQATDRAGNTGSHSGGTVTVLNDITPPQLSITLGPNPFVLSRGRPLKIVYSQDETARAEVEVLDGQQVIHYLGAQEGPAGSYARTWDGNLANGSKVATPRTYHIRVRAADPAGNQASVTAPVDVVLK